MSPWKPLRLSGHSVRLGIVLEKLRQVIAMQRDLGGSLMSPVEITLLVIARCTTPGSRRST